jgi:DNA (cytosine-5)-methyltransferase 1
MSMIASSPSVLSGLSVVNAVELFSGCGGLATGMSMCGVGHNLLVEFNPHAASTVQFNAERGAKYASDWPFLEADVRHIEWFRFRGDTQIVAGGPPCQPFSVGGKAAGSKDERDMWPEAIRAVREIQPELFVFENVRGLLRPAFARYVDWITAHLERPHVSLGGDESLMEHLARLGRETSEAQYDVQVLPVNAADYGAPQKRHRVFFVGVRRDLEISLGNPARTHSLERLVWDKWITGEYWERHRISKQRRSSITPPERRMADQLKSEMFCPPELAWVTCRDAFAGLGEPTSHDDGRNHRLQPGARSYSGHTGSPLDEPAKALKAGVHGVPGGENMLLLDSGKVRYFTIREAARLQGFGDDFTFPGSWTESMRQIGNAVPTMLAAAVSRWAIDAALPRFRKAA